MDEAQVKRFGVIGAGQMGRGIAQVAAAAGFDVVLCDAAASLAEKGKAQIGGVLGKLVEKGKLAEGDRQSLLDRIRPVESLGELTEVDIVVEAVTENLDLKLSIFREASEKAPKGEVTVVFGPPTAEPPLQARA